MGKHGPVLWQFRVANFYQIFGARYPLGKNDQAWKTYILFSALVLLPLYSPTVFLLSSNKSYSCSVEFIHVIYLPNIICPSSSITSIIYIFRILHLSLLHNNSSRIGVVVIFVVWGIIFEAKWLQRSTDKSKCYNLITSYFGFDRVLT